MKKCTFIILLLFVPVLNLLSQDLLIGRFDDYKNSITNINNNFIYVFKQNYYKKINLENFKFDSIPFYSKKDFKISEYSTLFVNSTLYFIHEQGGLVYENRNDSIIRIDNSYNHKLQNDSNIFSYNSKIHRYGGYGFWSARNFITYYNFSLNQWELEVPLNSMTPEGSFLGNDILIGNDLYIINSFMVNPDKNLEILVNKKLWNYNFKEKIWKMLGETDFTTGKYTRISPIKVDNKLFLINESNISIIDVLNNKIELYEKGLPSRHIFSQAFYNEKHFYFFHTDKDKLFLSQVEESELLGNFIGVKKLYTDKKKFKLYFFLILGLVFLILILVKISKYWLDRWGKIEVLENGIRYKRKFVQLDNPTIKILELLISSKKVNSSLILGLVEKEHFSKAHNERLKLQKINEINFKLKTLIEVDYDIIIASKSPFDKRNIEYAIKKSYHFFKK